MNEALDPQINNLSNEEKEFDRSLRPLNFSDFVGQESILENLKVFVEAANRREEALDHTLFHGPPGLGKTTLANVLAHELEVGIKMTSGPVLDKPGDLAGLLTNLDPRDILLIDEIHTPDSSRYFYADGYEERQKRDEPQKQLSKEFVRQWLIRNGFQGLSGQQLPLMNDDYIDSVSKRYIELYEQIMGAPFEKASTDNIAERMKHNLKAYF